MLSDDTSQTREPGFSVDTFELQLQSLPVDLKRVEPIAASAERPSDWSPSGSRLSMVMSNGVSSSRSSNWRARSGPCLRADRRRHFPQVKIAERF